MEIPKQWFIDHGFLSEDMTFQCLQCGKIFKANVPLVDHGTTYGQYFMCWCRAWTYHCNGYAIELHSGEQGFTLDELQEMREAIIKANNKKELRHADFAPVKHGHWIYDHWCEFKCSECGAYSNSKPYKGKENYCPNCGCKMDGEAK